MIKVSPGLQPMKACVVIGDIVKSQALADLPAVVRRLREVLGRLNAEHEPEILGAFRIFGGDSFEGALRTPRPAYDICREVAAALRPVRVRCVVAAGQVKSTARGNVLEMTGPVFQVAAESLAEMSRVRRRVLRAHGDVRFVTGVPDRDDSLNAIAGLIEVVRSRWTDRTWQLARLVAGGARTEEAAVALGITRQGARYQLEKHGIAQVLAVERQIRRRLARLT